MGNSYFDVSIFVAACFESNATFLMFFPIMQSELIHLLESGAVFRGAALSLLHCYALPDGASQLRFCLGQEGEPDEEKVGWRKYESMVGGRPFKKVALREINDKSKVLEPKNMER